MAITRRGFLSAASLSTFGLVTASTGLDLLIPTKAKHQ